MRFSTVFTLAFIAAPILAAPMPKKITNTSLDTAGFNGMIDELQIENDRVSEYSKHDTKKISHQVDEIYDELGYNDHKMDVKHVKTGEKLQILKSVGGPIYNGLDRDHQLDVTKEVLKSEEKIKKGQQNYAKEQAKQAKKQAKEAAKQAKKQAKEAAKAA